MTKRRGTFTPVIGGPDDLGRVGGPGLPEEPCPPFEPTMRGPADCGSCARLTEDVERMKLERTGIKALLVAARAGHLCGSCGEPIIDVALPCPECSDLHPLGHLEDDA